MDELEDVTEEEGEKAEKDKADEDEAEVKEEEEEEKKPKTKTVKKTIWDWVQVNNSKPIWLRGWV